MKKVLFLLLVATIAVGCKNKYGEEGQNVEDYVADRVKLTGFEVKDVSVVGLDTLMSDDRIEFGSIRFETMLIEFESEKISVKEYKDFLDSVMRHTYDIEFAWLSKEKNDSMRRLEKYEGAFRKVYTVKVKTDSRTQPEFNVRVLCDINGNPRMFEEQFQLEVKRFRERAESIYLAL